METIPKVIHYCWFGGNTLPIQYEKYIGSWKKYFPDYEIKEWNESNFDLNSCEYVKEAYTAKKWAFVSDYARLKILFEHGGLYFDTDVEVIKDMSEIIKNGSFMGCEKGKKYLGCINAVNPGLVMGMFPKHPFLKEILEEYQNRHFLKSDGSFDLTTICECTTKHLVGLGYNGNLRIERVADITIYPSEYFCPMDYETGKLSLTKNTYAIHHYAASWSDSSTKLKSRIYRRLVSVLGVKITERIRTAIRKMK